MTATAAPIRSTTGRRGETQRADQDARRRRTVYARVSLDRTGEGERRQRGRRKLPVELIDPSAAGRWNLAREYVDESITGTGKKAPPGVLRYARRGAAR